MLFESGIRKPEDIFYNRMYCTLNGGTLIISIVR